MEKIMLIMGPPGSGKTTVASQVAQRFSQSLHIKVDDLREMMVNGIEVPSAGWNEKTNQQFKMARSSAIHMAKVYAEQDVFVIIDDVSVPDDFYTHYAALFDIESLVPILLLPSLEKLTTRVLQRGGPWDEHLVKELPWFYSYLVPMDKDDWLVLDTGDWTIQETVDQVIKQIES